MTKELQPGLAGLEGRDLAAAQKLLVALFPRTAAVFGGRSERDDGWASEKRAASEQYFDRFFSFGIPVGDLADADVTSMLEALSASTPNINVEHVKSLIGRANAQLFLQKLRQHATELDAVAATRLSAFLGQLGGSFPEQPGNLMFDPHNQAAMVICDLVRRGGTEELRLEIGRSAVDHAEPLFFGAAVLRWANSSKLPESNEKLLTKEHIDDLFKRLAARIVRASERTPFFLSATPHPALLYSVWADYGDLAALRSHVGAAIGDDPDKAMAFLRCYTPSATWFDRGPYDRIVQIVEPQRLLDLLKRKFGETALNADPDFLGEATDEGRVALFASTNRSIAAAEAKAKADAPRAPNA